MTQVFLKLMNLSVSATWLALVVIALRFVLKKAPKWSMVLLWALVAIRLVCPFSLESALSLIPSAETIPMQSFEGPGFQVQTGIAPVDEQVNGYLADRYFEGVTVPAENGATVLSILTVLWLIGVALMLLYLLVSFLRLRVRMADAVLLHDNIWQSGKTESAFVLGLVRPRIYLPVGLLERDHVLAHERAHIKRGDHWWKALGFVLLSLHWFNPVMWFSYVLLCRDIELACDEKVIRTLDDMGRADYSQALLNNASAHRSIAACPLAFGEVGIKSRVKSVLHYKKPTFWIVAVAVVLCIVLAVCFLTDPMQEAGKVDEEIPTNEIWNDDVTYGVSITDVGYFEDTDQYFFENAVNKGYFYLSNVQHLPLVCITEAEQLREIPNIDLSAKYDKAFFEEYTLFLAYLTDNSTAETHQVEFLRVYQGELSIHVGDYISDAEGADVMVGWLMEVWVPNGELAGITKYDALVDSVTHLNAALPETLRVYRMEESQEIMKPTFGLYEDGTYSFSFSAVSSHFGVGTYEWTDRQLILYESGTDDTIYVFDIKGDTLVFDMDASTGSTWFSDMDNGSVFQ